VPWGEGMRKSLSLAFLLVCLSSDAIAQEFAGKLSTKQDTHNVPNWLVPTLSVSQDFIASEPLSFALLDETGFAPTKLTLPFATPAPKPHARRVREYSFEIGIEFTYVRFRSQAIDVGLYGLNTDFAYFPRKWLGAEANFTGAVGPHVFGGNSDQSRYAAITGGPKIIWHQEGWTPWLHALGGVVHVNPQVAGSSKHGGAFELGGGLDFPVGPLAWRVEGDYIRSQLYSQGQNNFQVCTGIVLQF
jgi:hypothetical protein